MFFSLEKAFLSFIKVPAFIDALTTITYIGNGRFISDHTSMELLTRRIYYITVALPLTAKSLVVFRVK